MTIKTLAAIKPAFWALCLSALVVSCPQSASAIQAELRQHLIQHEDVVLQPYRDTSGQLHIGVGRLLEGEGGITEAEAMAMLANDIERVTAALDEQLPWWRQLSPIRQQALAAMGFQLGVSGLLEFDDMLTALRQGQHSDAADHALDSLWAREQTPGRAGEVAYMLRFNREPGRIE